MLTISAEVKNSHNHHEITVTTNQNAQSITIAPKSTGWGSSANGGELLFLALATCYCNDIYREAAKRGITVKKVEVTVKGEFDSAPGSPAENITYSARVEAEASEADIVELMRHTDSITEIQNTLRRGVSVKLDGIEAISV